MIECVNYLSKEKEIGIDIETSTKSINYENGGLIPQLSNIVMLQVGTIDRQFIIDTRNTDITPLIPILTDKNKVLVGHNLKFEYKFLLDKYNIRLINIYDTMLAEQILYNGLGYRYGLNNLNKKYLGFKVDKDIRLSFRLIGNNPFKLDQIVYGAEDIVNPLKIKSLQEEEIYKSQLEECVKLEFDFLKVLGDMELKGMKYNPVKWSKTYHRNLHNAKIYEKILDSYILNREHNQFIDYQLDLFTEKDLTTRVSWTSGKQVIEYFQFLGICPQAVSKTTKKLSYTVDAKVLLASLKTTNKDIKKEYKQLIKIYLRFKELTQRTTTFGEDYFKYINPVTKRVHSEYRQILSTGRISSGKPNLQNIPAEYGFRYAFDAPKGYKIINADFSGQESVVLANKSLDKDLLEFYRKGHGDMHSFVAKKLFPELEGLTLEEIKQKAANKRQIAKSANFALAYGGNGYTIANNLGISPEEGDKVYTEYFKAFPGLNDFFQRTIKASLDQGYIVTDNITKRRYYFKDIDQMNKHRDNKEWKEFFMLKGKYERASMNYVIQGEAGSITKYAAILAREWILDNNLQDEVFLTNIVHDEINLECADSHTEKVRQALEDCMGKSGDRWCKTIPLRAKAVISEYWKH